jgi:hypothetical protein
MAKENCWNKFTLETNFPHYPWWRIPIQNHLAGISDYHNRGCLWLQPGILYAICLHELGHKKKSEEIIQLLSNQIVKFNDVYEVHERNGQPVNRRFYKSEHPFAWSAGLFIYACTTLSLLPGSVHYKT